MAAPAPRLSKSRFTIGLQCHKRLWWTVHEPDAPELEPDEGLQAIFDAGTRVGEVARSYVPGGVLVDLPHDALEARVETTRALLERGVPAIYEASFFENGVFVAVDILERTARGHGLVEVKSTTRLKREHVTDAAIQAHVVRAAGVSLDHVHVMHLDRECVHPRLESLFARADVTADVAELEPSLPAVIDRQLEVLGGPLPQVAVGDHCSTPWDCPFRARCWPVRPEHHVSTLYYIGRRAAELEAQGIARVHDVPDDYPLDPAARRQVRAVRSGELIVEPGLASALEAFASPLAFMDFETVARPIPVWDGCRPYDQVPAQFSALVEDGHGGHRHHEWLPDAPGDPRAEIARAVVEACSGATRVVAYHAPFERDCLALLARSVPHHARELLSIADRLLDLLPVVRDHVYHPDFRGGFGLKNVAPVLVPALRFEGMSIADGAAASRALEQLLFGSGPVDSQRRADLLAYCRLDTWAMVGILDRLRALASA